MTTSSTKCNLNEMANMISTGKGEKNVLSSSLESASGSRTKAVSGFKIYLTPSIYACPIG